MSFQIKYYLCKIHSKLTRTVKYLLIIFCLLILGFQQPNSFDTNAKIKAVYIYGFTKYFEWPEKKKEGNFIIYVVGKSDPLVNELKGLAGKKKVGNQEIEIKNSNSFDASIASSIIYFTPDQELKYVGEAASKNKNKGALVISEAAGACKSGGGSVNFIYIDNKLKFDYNKTAAVKAGLKTNESFKAMSNSNCD